MIMALASRTFHHREGGRAWLDVIEFFAGKGNLSRAGINAGNRVCGLDKIIHPEHDVLESASALRIWFGPLAATKPSSLVWCGTPCSSYTIMRRATSERSEENEWMGNECRTFVHEGNCLADLTACLMLVSFATDAVPGLEQSGSSVMARTPCLRGVLSFMQFQRVTTYHACFGAESLKPLQLWSSSTFVESLSRSKPSMRGAGVTLAVRSEGGGFTGEVEGE